MSKTSQVQREETGEQPVLDMNLAAVKKLIEEAKKKGYVTYDQLNAVLPEEEYSSEQIEDIMSMLSDMGITVVEPEEGEEPDEAAARAKRKTNGASASEDDAPD